VAKKAKDKGDSPKGSLKDRMRSALGLAVRDAGKAAEKPPFLPIGIAGIDYALGGGFMWGRLIEVFGESTVGKSLLQDYVLIAVQKLGGVAAKFNTEQAHNPFFFSELGGNGDDLLLYPDPEDAENAEKFPFIEDVFIKIDEILSVKLAGGDTEPVAIAWDSIAATMAASVADVSPDKLNMKHNLARAVSLSNCCPRIVYLASQAKAIIMASNQIRESPDAFERDTKTPGGKSWPFYSSQRIELRKGATIKADNGEPIGHWINGKVVKNRLDAALRTFRVPCYTRTDLPHPIYDLPIGPGIHKAEALWEFCLGRKVGNEDSAKLVPYFYMPDGKPVVEAANQGWYQLHPAFGDKKFRKADWPHVLEEFPALWDLPKVPE
jgi:RecA/RadA recombinase